MEPEYVDIPTSGGELLRITYEMTVGDIVVAASVLLLLVFLILSSILKILWR